jgi:hypothetical protein
MRSFRARARAESRHNRVEKVRDTVGLYLAPSDRALLLSVDESEIRALDRAAPIPPMTFGSPERPSSAFPSAFTPTSASWLNLAERWFALLSERQIKGAPTEASARWKPPFASTSRSPTNGRRYSSGRKRLTRSSPR